jgi:hypothetical protein
MARTIADLDGGAGIEPRQLSEAIQYRALDRSYWAENNSPDESRLPATGELAALLH